MFFVRLFGGNKPAQFVNSGKTKATWKGMRNGKFPDQLIFEPDKCTNMQKKFFEKS